MWYKEKSIFAKSIASVILSNVDPGQAIEKFEDILADIYPNIKKEKLIIAERSRRYLEASRGRKIYIRNLDA